jgi:hypothetical protein
VLTGRRLAQAVVAVCLTVVTLAASDDDPKPAPEGPAITTAAVQAALLQAKDVGQTWTTPEATPPPSTLPSLCAGDGARPAVPGGPTAASSSLVDEGDAGAQTFDQIALVYADAKAATAARESLQATAKICAPTASHAPQATTANPEAGYTETVTSRPLVSGAWSGFAMIRHKVYEKSSPGTADTAVAVLSSRNAVLVTSYAVYRVEQPSASPSFSEDWQRLVGAVVSRVDAAAK